MMSFSLKLPVSMRATARITSYNVCYTKLLRFVCPHCHEVIDLFKKGGGRQMAEEMGAPFLGAVPVDPDMVSAGDSGKPIVLAHPDSRITSYNVCYTK